MSIDSPPESSLNGGVRNVAKKLLWPARRFFDPRFTGIHQAVQEVKTLVEADLNAANETATYTGRTLDSLLAHAEAVRTDVEAVRTEVEAVRTEVDDLHGRFSFDPESSHSIEDIDEFTARVLNYAASHKGFTAQANLWFNPPLLVGYEPHKVVLRWINERIAEVPYAFRALCRVRPDADVLDVGATESSVCLSLATLGYNVTAIDPRPNPLTHERLRVVVGHVERWEEDAEFDAVLCLSTIEHIGTAAYKQEAATRRLDLEALKRIHELTRSGGLLVLTTAVGRAAVNELGRVYDREGFDRLLKGWDVTDLTLVQRRDPTTWVTVDGPIDALEPDAETVAMVTATKTA